MPTEFDPDAYVESKSDSTFNPDTYVSQKDNVQLSQPQQPNPAVSAMGGAMGAAGALGVPLLKHKIIDKFARTVMAPSQAPTAPAPTSAPTQGPGDVVNWATGKTPASGQYGRGYLGGTSMEHEAQLQKQADLAEQLHSGFKAVPGGGGIIAPSAAADNITKFKASKILEEEAALRRAALKNIPQNMVRSKVGTGIGIGYNAADLLQQNNVPQQAISAVGTAGAALPLVEKALPKNVQLPGPLKKFGAAASVLAPITNWAINKYKAEPEGHAAGGSIQGYAGGGWIEELLKKAYQGAGKSGARLAREAEYVHDIVPTHNFSTPKQLSIQDLQGGILVPVPGDRSLTGHSLRSVAGTQLANPVELHGGPRYGQRQADLGKNNFWASEFNTADTFQNKAAKAAELAGGNPVYGMYTAMAPDAANFALHKTKSLLEQIPSMSPLKENVQAFNDMMRQKFPEFVGIEHPDVMQQFTLAHPDLRKYMADRLNKPSVAKEFGLPSGEATMHAITEPELRDVGTGATGFSVGKLDPNTSVMHTDISEHPTYNTNIPGQYQGSMIAQLPWEQYFPDAAAKIAADPRHAPHAWGTFKMGTYNQPVTQELVDKIAPIEEFVKSGGLDFLKGQ